MSIYPRIIHKDDIKPVTLHMRVENKNKDEISGRIVFVITDCENNKKKIEEKITVGGMGKIDKYFTYLLGKDSLVGRYYVDGRFYVGKEYIQSLNFKTDFFDVLENKRKQ